LIEDVCESHGATFGGRKLGTYGFDVELSFYYAHHLTTIEGGMVCTTTSICMKVSACSGHIGMVRYRPRRKSSNRTGTNILILILTSSSRFRVERTQHRDHAVSGRNQLKRRDDNNQRRTENLLLFLENLDSKKYQTDFSTVRLL